MKHLKSYENLTNNTKLQIGDYVICKEIFTAMSPDEWQLQEFINNNIGQVVYLDIEKNYPYYIEYKNIPNCLNKYFSDGDDIHTKFRGMKLYEIIYWSPNIEDLEPIIAANKYNL